MEGAIVPVGFTGQVQNEDELFLQIIEAEKGFEPPLDPKTTLGMIIVSFLIGMYFKSILYVYVLTKYKLKKQTPIDVLIITASIIQHITQAFNLVGYILIVWNNASAPYAPGTWHCFMSLTLNRFDIFYMTIGSFGISLYRILYIKGDTWVKYRIGEKRLLKIILFGGLFMGVLMLGVSTTSYYQQLVFCNCPAPKPETLEILTAYETSRRGNQDFSMYNLQTRAVVLLMMISMTIGEIVMYVMFFSHVYQNDNKETLRYLLGANIIRARNRKNAISFLGQFCAFCVEFGIYIIVAIITIVGKANYAYEVGIFITIHRVTGFAILSMVENLTSNALRSRVFKF